jgi:biopolymer transport protein ExbD
MMTKADSIADVLASGVRDQSDEIIAHRTIRQRRGRDLAQVSLNLTPMIDVVFQLLIYFLVATEFKLNEEVYRLDLPRQLQSDQPLDPFELDEEPLKIIVASTGVGGVNYVLRVEGPFPQPATFDELHLMLRERQINEATIGGLFAADHPIIIEPAGTAKWEHAVRVFNAAALARYTNVQFSRPVE